MSSPQLYHTVRDSLQIARYNVNTVKAYFDACKVAFSKKWHHITTDSNSILIKSMLVFFDVKIFNMISQTTLDTRLSILTSFTQ